MKHKNIYKRSTYYLSKSNRLLLLGIFLLSFFPSCESFTEVPLPDSELSGAVVFEDALTAEAALVAIYADIREFGLVSGKSSGAGVLMGHYADELDYYSSTGLAAEDFYNNNVLPTNQAVESIWDVAYREVYAANSLLERISVSDMVSQDDRLQLQGEALFLRAFIHFYMANLFGAVPYIATTDYRENTKTIKKSPDEVYRLVIEDLKKAKSIIGAHYPTQDRTRANKAVVSAFLSRVYLYDGQWQNAIAEASMVIGNGDYPWESDLQRIFLIESGSSIWQLSPQSAGQNAEEGNTYFFETAPPPNWALSPVLVERFPGNDLRGRYWMENISNGGDGFYRPNKYRQPGMSDMSMEYSVMFRMAEQYLIRAEAHANLGDIGAAIKDLNKIRLRAGLSALENSTKEALIDSILIERNRELFTEQGHRWFDLKRTGRASKVLTSVKPGWTPSDTVLPLPEKELLINPNLNPQNPGY